MKQDLRKGMLAAMALVLLNAAEVFGADSSRSQAIDAIEQQKISLAQDEAVLDEMEQKLAKVRFVKGDLASLTALSGIMWVVDSRLNPLSWFSITERINGYASMGIGAYQLYRYLRDKTRDEIKTQQRLILSKKMRLAQLESEILRGE